MNNIKNIIDNIQLRRFGNPINYESSYNTGNITTIKQSDVDALKPYATISRNRYLTDDIPDKYNSVDEYLCDILQLSKDELIQKRQELECLTEWEKFYMFSESDGCGSIPIPDDIFLMDDSIRDYLQVNHHTLIGPELGTNNDYLKYNGSASDRLDYYGQPLTSAYYKYFNSNCMNINNNLIFYRTVYITYTETDESDVIYVYQKSDKAHLVYEQDERGYFPFRGDGDELREDIIIVDDLDDNNTIITQLIQYVNTLEENYGKYELREENTFQKVKYSNPINLKINKNE